VLGGLMLDAAAWDQIADRVIAEDFYRVDHRLDFRSSCGLIERSQPCDAVTLSDISKARACWTRSAACLTWARGGDTPTTANIRAYADNRARTLRAAAADHRGQSDRRSALEPEGSEAREIVDEAERAVFEMPNAVHAVRSASEPSRAFCRMWSTASMSCTTPTGSMTGIFDRIQKTRRNDLRLAAGDLIQSSPAAPPWAKPPSR